MSWGPTGGQPTESCSCTSSQSSEHVKCLTNLASQSTWRAACVQDFERAFHAELLLEADLEAKHREDFRKLPKWIRQYAYRAWQDRIYFDRNVTWFQQEVLLLTMPCAHPDALADSTVMKKEKKEKSTPLGVMTGASVPRSSLRQL